MWKGLTFREVGDTDYDNVIQVYPNGWSNRDYLPDKYHEYMADPNCRCFASETETGQMVGFHASLLVDGGETLLRFAGRVKVEYQDQGVFQALIRHMYTFYESQSQLKWEVIVVIEPALKKFKDQELGFSILMHKKRDLYKFDFVSVQVPDSSSPHFVQVLTDDDLRVLFSCGDACQKLFPNNRIFLHCKPFKAMQANVRHFIHKNIVLATAKNVTQMTSYGTDDTRRQQFLESVSLFSIGDYYFQKSGLHYNIELYGEDMTSFPLHLQRHLQHLESFKTPVVELYVYTGEHVDISSIDDAMKVYGVERDLTEKQHSIFLLERPFCRALKDLAKD